ncbi:tRNA lysidine(34) synthetase TilS [Pseudomonadota bacterium]
MLKIDFNTIKKEKKVAVAVSGGIDSTALVLLVNDFIKKKKNKIHLVALTIDHKLRECSTKEAKFVQELMSRHEIEHHILTWEGQEVTSNIEFQARQARYSLLTNFCKEKEIKCLLVGHHKQDQAENFLIRLFRGSGIDGLASMKNESEINGVKILRPLLDIRKEELMEYLIDSEIKWVEDESNNDEKFLRNKIRKFLNSFKDKNNIIDRINSSVNTIATVKEIIEQNLLERSKGIVQNFPEGYIKIEKNKFTELDKELGFRLLSWVLMEVSGNRYKPRFEKLKELYEHIIFNKKIKPRTFYGCVVESENKTNDFLIFYRERNAISNVLHRTSKNKILWDNRFEIEVKEITEFFVEEIVVRNLTESELKKIVKELRKEKEIRGVYKKIMLTVPVINLKNSDFVYIPHLDYSNDFEISENLVTKKKIFTVLFNK